MKFVAARKQCKDNPFLYFHGNTKLFYIADSYIHAN